jgi:hypothetical protein
MSSQQETGALASAADFRAWLEWLRRAAMSTTVALGIPFAGRPGCVPPQAVYAGADWYGPAASQHESTPSSHVPTDLALSGWSGPSDLRLGHTVRVTNLDGSEVGLPHTAYRLLAGMAHQHSYRLRW